MKKFEGRILQLGKFYPVNGGVEKVEFELMIGLSENNIRCDMMCAALDGKSRKIEINSKAELLACHSWMKIAATMISPAMIFTLRKRRDDYNVIHVHHPDPMACLALFLSGYKGRIVLHWHSDIIKQKFLLKLYNPLQNWLLKRADIIVGTSPIYLKESKFLKDVQHKTLYIPIGIEPIMPDKKIVSEIRDTYKRKKIIFSLGRLVTYKGFEYLIKAANFLDDNYIILIGGTGPLRDKLLRLVEECNLKNKVRLLGHISDEMLPSYYGACDVFCLSSIMKTEAFGIVQLEAMSCGKPIVATNIPQSGVPFVNAHGESGLNVEPSNAKALAKAIIAITEDFETYNAYSAGAIKRYREYFTKDKMIENCLRLYETL